VGDRVWRSAELCSVSMCVHVRAVVGGPVGVCWLGFGTAAAVCGLNAWSVVSREVG
jgi:hypothetical protein